MNEGFRIYFGEIEDRRIERTKKHALLDVIAVAILGVMAGAQSFEEMEDFGNLHEEWLGQYLALENGIPSHDTINRVLQMIEPKAFEEAFLKWVKSLRSLLKETVVPIDGKTLCGSHERCKGLKALHVVSAWSVANGLSLGQMKVSDKTNEITVVPELLKQLMLEGAIVTMDAMGCQRDIAKAIRDQKADYVLAVKGNQGQLEEAISECFKLGKADQMTQVQDEMNADHGRLEARELSVMDAKRLHDFDLKKWPGIRSVARIVCKRESPYEKSNEERFYISSLPATEAPLILKAIRSHWQIENTLHWSLDVTFKEDACRVRDENTALNLAWMRKMSLSLLKGETSFKRGSIRRKQLKLWSQPDYFFQVIRQI